MAHFAKVEKGIVTQVIVAEQDYIDSLENSNEWIQTSYNTYGGVHILGGNPLRKNYAGVGYIYDSEMDAFIPPQPFASWILDNESCTWQPPIQRPDSNDAYVWNEENQIWELIATFEEISNKQQ